MVIRSARSGSLVLVVVLLACTAGTSAQTESDSSQPGAAVAAGVEEVGAAPKLGLAPATSTEGHATLSWSLPAGMEAGVLQQSTVPEFPSANPASNQAPVVLETPVVGSGTLVQTGLANGTYYFRVGQPGQWSAVQQLQVRHHPPSTAFFYFALGLAVFVALVGIILHGSLRQGGSDA